MAKASKAGSKSSETVKRRQAVVIVHGIGEQRPLATLRSFAEAVWGGSTVPDESNPKDHHSLWIVPDTRAGLTELARIRTRNVREDGESVATDFYELFWADRLTGNTLGQLRAWFGTLLLRWPHQVPRETFGLWLLLWALTIGLIGLFVWVGKDASWAGFWQLFEIRKPPPPARPIWISVSVSLVFTALLFLFLNSRLRGSLQSWANAGKKFKSTWQSQSAAASSLPMWLGPLLVMLIPAIAGYSLFRWFPWDSFPLVKGIAIGLAILVTLVVTYGVVPYFGDVARYVSTSPEAVGDRAEIRERGLALMRALHSVRHDGESGAAVRTPRDEEAANGYVRIVVVGHSLGSIIAYDVLRLLWEEIGPTGKNPPSPAVLDHLVTIDDYCKRRYGEPDRIDTKEYRTLQAGLIQELRKSAPHASEPVWLVSDFVTLGSPLTHAEFLVSPDRNSLEQRKAERQFPTTPPLLEPGRSSFLYKDADETLAHHAAMFAATRWVNIFDEQEYGIRGDLISGPCQPNFGPGIVDVPIRITRKNIWRRLFTHTEYWNVEADGELRDDAWRALEDDDNTLEASPPADKKGPPAHVAVLRLALRLKRRIPASKEGLEKG